MLPEVKRFQLAAFSLAHLLRLHAFHPQFCHRNAISSTLSNLPASCQASLMKIGAQFLLLTTEAISALDGAIEAWLVLRAGPVQLTAGAVAGEERETPIAIG